MVRWSKGEELKLKKLIINGKTFVEAAEIMNRKISSIRRKGSRLKLKSSYISQREVEYKKLKNGCWKCKSHKTKSQLGYPRLLRKGKCIMISRFIYEKYKGKIPFKKIIRHTCDNSYCINPNHLIIGTHKDNVQDRVDRKRSACGEKNGRAKLNKIQVLKIYNNEKLTITELSKKYNVDWNLIHSIKQKKIWKHILK